MVTAFLNRWAGAGPSTSSWLGEAARHTSATPSDGTAIREATG